MIGAGSIIPRCGSDASWNHPLHVYGKLLHVWRARELIDERDILADPRGSSKRVANWLQQPVGKRIAQFSGRRPSAVIASDDVRNLRITNGAKPAAVPTVQKRGPV